MATIVDTWALVDTKEITLRPSGGEVAGWKNLTTLTITLVPGEEEVADWKLLKTLTITLKPGVEEVSGWKLLKTFDISLSPPTKECSTDADCPEGYVCVDGVCVKEKAGFPWLAVAIGAAALGGILLISSAKKEEKE